MDERDFDMLRQFGEVHWWHRAKRELAIQELDRRGHPAGPIVDVGCGTGNAVKALAEAGLAPALGTDDSEYALRAAQELLGANVVLRSDAAHLPLRSASLAALTAMDVVEHLDDDIGAIAEFARVLRPGGLAVIVVPAYSWMWSAKDVALGHRRRYTAKSLSRVVIAGGLVVRRLTYFHSWLLPLAAVANRARRREATAGSDAEASFVGPRVNAALTAMSRIERRIGQRTRIPAGLSVLALGERPRPVG